MEPAGSRRAVRYGLYALLGGAVLPFGGVEPWAVASIEIGAAVLGLLALRAVRANPALLPGRARVALALFLALAGIGLAQIVPLPAPLAGLVPAPTRRARAVIGSLLEESGEPPRWISLSRADTLDATLRLLAYACVGVAAAVAIRGTRERSEAARVVAGVATFEAAYGIAEYLSGHQHIFGYAKRFYLEEATGTFINRNHFAGFLAMALPFAVAFLLRAGPWSARRVAAAGSVAVIWSGVLLSYSRAGLGVSLVSALVASSAARSRRRTVAILALVLAVPLVVMLAHDLRPPAERVGHIGSDALARGGRVAVWSATLAMVPEHAPAGSGLGTFEEAFASRQPAGVDKHYDHAHSDWLECALEGGTAGPILCAALLALVLYPARGRRGVLAAAPVAGLSAVALHSLVDFGLRIPAVAVLAAILAGLAVTRGDDEPVSAFPSPPAAR